jgi:hypothetical protein
VTLVTILQPFQDILQNTKEDTPWLPDYSFCITDFCANGVMNIFGTTRPICQHVRTLGKAGLMSSVDWAVRIPPSHFPFVYINAWPHDKPSADYSGTSPPPPQPHGQSRVSNGVTNELARCTWGSSCTSKRRVLFNVSFISWHALNFM